jgi:mannose-6-phosphate isomerase-like protein (cupin superfamily)
MVTGNFKNTTMLTSNQTLDMTPIDAVFHIAKASQETNGQSLEIKWKLLPTSGGTPHHIHPSAKETYKVIEGQLDTLEQSRTSNTNGTNLKLN